MNPTKTQAIKTFLEHFAHLDLANLYNHDMEVQVNVGQDGGTRIEGDFKGRQWHGWTDGAQTWKFIRIPNNANSDPNYQDSEIRFDLAAHAEGIGMTGWNWAKKTSQWVAFDFDSIIGHSDKHQNKLTEDELLKIQDLVKDVPWVQIRKSTSGKGLHLYVFLEPVGTDNHTEHGAVARSILGKLSGVVGFDFATKVDVCGGNMWVWHRKMDPIPKPGFLNLDNNNQGLLILKPHTMLCEVPPNWRDHIKVMAGKRRRNLPRFIEEQGQEDLFQELTGQRIRCPVDEEHKKFMGWINDTYPNSSWWDSEHHMYVTHTSLIKEAHGALDLKGPFETVAEGREKGNDWNCFMFPLRKGGWTIRRYSLGAREHQLWEQDGKGWTRCFLNRDPDLSSASRVHDGIEEPAGGYFFKSAEQAQKAAFLLGADLKLPLWILNRKSKLKEHKSGRLIVEISHQNEDLPMDGWLVDKNKFSKLFDVRITAPNEPDTVNFDDEVRHLTTETGEDFGWVIRGEQETGKDKWHSEPFVNVKTYLQSRGYGPKEIANIMGSSIARCWILVNRPFQDEYLSDRQWNRNAAQFRYIPTLDKDNLNYDTWLKILNHCGKGLDDVVLRDQWCKDNGIQTGCDYLKCWIASMFQFPLEPLPYLFLYGEQESGKSILHEALSILMTKGAERADTALINQSGFNGELEHAILCIIEETDLKKNTPAYNRIKDWVTSKHLPIHKKQRQPYTVPNTTHWIQCANTHLACPVFMGDTRITMVHVDLLENKIPKRELLESLEKEAPDFMAEILGLELPRYQGRLNVPILITEEKEAAQKANMTWLEMFIEEQCHYVTGKTIKFSEFYERFVEWLDPNYLHEWSKIKVGRELPPIYPIGRSTKDNGQYYIGNISWSPREPQEEIMKKLVLKNGILGESLDAYQ